MCARAGAWRGSVDQAAGKGGKGAEERVACDVHNRGALLCSVLPAAMRTMSSAAGADAGARNNTESMAERNAEGEDVASVSNETLQRGMDTLQEVMTGILDDREQKVEELHAQLRQLGATAENSAAGDTDGAVEHARVILPGDLLEHSLVAAKAAYDPLGIGPALEETDHRFSAWKISDVENEANDGKFVVFSLPAANGGDPDTVVVSFSGSQTWQDWVGTTTTTNFQIWPRITPIGLEHMGFGRRANQIPYLYLIAQMRAGVRVVLTGHSLGGAVALLVAVRMIQRLGLTNRLDLIHKQGLLKVVTFGAPLVGEVSLAQLMAPYHRHIVHFVCDGDPVPRLLTLLGSVLQSARDGLFKFANAPESRSSVETVLTDVMLVASNPAAAVAHAAWNRAMDALMSSGARLLGWLVGKTQDVLRYHFFGTLFCIFPSLRSGPTMQWTSDADTAQSHLNLADRSALIAIMTPQALENHLLDRYHRQTGEITPAVIATLPPPPSDVQVFDVLAPIGATECPAIVSVTSVTVETMRLVHEAWVTLRGERMSLVRSFSIPTLGLHSQEVQVQRSGDAHVLLVVDLYRAGDSEGPVPLQTLRDFFDNNGCLPGEPPLTAVDVHLRTAFHYGEEQHLSVPLSHSRTGDKNITQVENLAFSQVLVAGVTNDFLSADDTRELPNKKRIMTALECITNSIPIEFALLSISCGDTIAPLFIERLLSSTPDGNSWFSALGVQLLGSVLDLVVGVDAAATARSVSHNIHNVGRLVRLCPQLCRWAEEVDQQEPDSVPVSQDRTVRPLGMHTPAADATRAAILAAHRPVARLLLELASDVLAMSTRHQTKDAGDREWILPAVTGTTFESSVTFRSLPDQADAVSDRSVFWQADDQFVSPIHLLRYWHAQTDSAATAASSVSLSNDEGVRLQEAFDAVLVQGRDELLEVVGLASALIEPVPSGDANALSATALCEATDRFWSGVAQKLQHAGEAAGDLFNVRTRDVESVRKRETLRRNIGTKLVQAHDHSHRGLLTWFLKKLFPDFAVEDSVSLAELEATLICELRQRGAAATDTEPALPGVKFDTSVQDILSNWQRHFNGTGLVNDMDDRYHGLMACQLKMLLGCAELRHALSGIITIGMSGTSNSGKTIVMQEIVRSSGSLGNVRFLPQPGISVRDRTCVPRLHSIRGQDDIQVLDMVGLTDDGVAEEEKTLEKPETAEITAPGAARGEAVANVSGNGDSIPGPSLRASAVTDLSLVDSLVPFVTLEIRVLKNADPQQTSSRSTSLDRFAPTRCPDFRGTQPAKHPVLTVVNHADVMFKDTVAHVADDIEEAESREEGNGDAVPLVQLEVAES